MIHLILGTRAQYIKTAPVIWRLKAQGIPFRLVDTGQHAGLTDSIRREMELPPPEVTLRTGESISRIRDGLRWLAGWMGWGIARPGAIRDRLFAVQGGIALVHGDTVSTWLGAWLARRAGLKVAHLEAGLRSFHFLSPFPEEMCRWRTTRMAHLLFASSGWAAGNLRRARCSGEVVELTANTGLEAVRFSMAQPVHGEEPAPWPTYGLATIHRMETLYSAARLRFVVRALRKASSLCPILFLLHEPTRAALRRHGLLARLEEESRIRCRPLASHPAFLRLLRAARFVLTDGGSVQEESFYVGVPCLLLRDRTERPEGFIPPGNVTLCRWRWDRLEAFLGRLPEPGPPGNGTGDAWGGEDRRSPSQRVVEALLRADAE